MKDYSHLSDEELIRTLRDGNSEIMDYIMEKYKYLVRKRANAMYLIGGDSDDLIQEGMIGLFKAVRDYDTEQQTAFGSFADLCISRQIYSAIQASNRKKHTPLNSYVSLYASKDEKEGTSQLMDILQTIDHKNPEELVIDKERAAMIEDQLNTSLSQMELKVLHLHMEGISYVQIADLLDKSPKSIDNALQRIKNKLHSILQE